MTLTLEPNLADGIVFLAGLALYLLAAIDVLRGTGVLRRLRTSPLAVSFIAGAMIVMPLGSTVIEPDNAWVDSALKLTPMFLIAIAALLERRVRKAARGERSTPPSAVSNRTSNSH
ncbi:MAG: hypothetical protein AAF270_10200 [Pseudomonadota bacterium]